MPTFLFCLTYCAILSIADATVSSHQASSLRHNTTTKSISTPSVAFPGLGNFSTVSKTSPNTPIFHNSILHNDTKTVGALSSSSCCFVVQDTINVRYWQEYLTSATTISNQITSLITFATKYIDTVVMTNVSTVIENRNVTSNITSTLNTPDIPNNDATGPTVIPVELTPSLNNTFGASFASPTQYYLYPSVKIINVPAVSDVSGRPACATKSSYFTTCPTYTENADANIALYFTGINSNAGAYFNPGPNQGSATIPVVQIPFSAPFVYAPVSDQFPSNINSENLGYVPQTLIEWMAQNSDYVAKFPSIASCLPGGPSVAYLCPAPLQEGHIVHPEIVAQHPPLQLLQPGSTVYLTVTVTEVGCFHPGECPTTAAPGATPAAATAEATPEAVRPQNAGTSNTVPAGNPSPLASPGQASTPQLPSPPVPAPVEASGDTPVVSPEGKAANPPPSPSPNPPPNEPATPPTDAQGLGAIVAGAFSITPTPLPGDEDIEPTPGPTPILSYSISIAPSASAVIINGVTSVLKTEGYSVSLLAGPLPITVGSQQVIQNAASQYVVGGQTLTPGAPPIIVQGTVVSLAPSASALVIAGSTIILSSAGAPAFTVGAETFTVNSASQYIAGGQTLAPGGAAVTISGSRISLATSGTQLVVGSSTIGLIPTFAPPSPTLPPLTLGSQTFTANGASYYIIDGQTLIPGGPAITISGTRLSLAPSATQIIVGSSTISLNPGITPPPIKFDSQTFSANSASEYIIDGQTLIPGAPAIIISHTPISLAANGLSAIIGTSTELLFPSPKITPPPITFDSQTFTANSASYYIIDGQTLTPGGPAITISGTRIDLASDDSYVVIGTSTSPLFFNPTPTLPPFTFGTQIITANSLGLYLISDQTLTPGGPAITISGTRISLASGDSYVVIGTSTELLLPDPLPTPTFPALTIAGQIITPNSAGAYVIGSKTLTPGGEGVVVPASLFSSLGAVSASASNEPSSSIYVSGAGTGTGVDGNGGKGLGPVKSEAGKGWGRSGGGGMGILIMVSVGGVVVCVVL